MFRTFYVHHQEDYIVHAALYGKFSMHKCIMAKIIPRFPNASFYPLSWQKNVLRLYQILIGWEYKFRGILRIKISVDIRLGLLLLLGQRMMCLGYDRLVILWLLPLELVVIIETVGQWRQLIIRIVELVQALCFLIHYFNCPSINTKNIIKMTINSC